MMAGEIIIRHIRLGYACLLCEAFRHRPKYMCPAYSRRGQIRYSTSKLGERKDEIMVNTKCLVSETVYTGVHDDIHRHIKAQPL
jgi:hypothetical protein